MQDHLITIEDRYRSAIPQELLELPQWVMAAGKVPRDPKTNRNASVSDPSTWARFEDAIAGAETYAHDALGLVFTEPDPYVGIDLDNAVDPSRIRPDYDLGLTLPGVLPWAREIAESFRARAYIEYSRSGTGLHIIALGTLPKAGTRRAVPNEPGAKIEMYASGRFFVLTGASLGALRHE